MNQELQALQRQIDMEFGVYQSKFNDLENARNQIKSLQNQQDDLNMVMAMFNKLIDEKRKQTMDKIVNVVSYGLQKVFENPEMKLVVTEKMQRNQKFYVLGYSDGGGGVSTQWDEASGGVRDVVILMLKVIFLTISSNRRFLVMDESFVGLDAQRRENLIEFLNELTAKFDVQFFFVSHLDDLNAAATDLFKISGNSTGVQIKKQV
jgi:DNA repair exonuclease SbcCD ATPase subunit